MQPKLIISFEHYNEPEFHDRSLGIASALENNVNFPAASWSAQVPNPTEIAAEVAAYDDLYDAASHGDKIKIQARNAGRKKLTKTFKTVAAYLEIVAQGSVAMLATTGYEMRRDIVRSVTRDPLPAPQNLTVVRAKASGGLVVRATVLVGADVYIVEICVGDPGVEANWVREGQHKHCNRIDLTGLTPNKTTYVRLCGWNDDGDGAWATSAGILVL